MSEIVALDTAYFSRMAVTAGVLIKEWIAPLPSDTFRISSEVDSDYISGQFYKRELPCILRFLDQAPWQPDLIIIDGYVFLARDRMGLGMHLYEAIDKRIPIVGIAKKAFKHNDTALPILRGKSKRPLYITAAGITVQEAAENVKAMSGKNRIPNILKIVDNLSKTPA